MGDKSIQKKKFIIDTARGVFAKKGFKSVTMKDIVDACDISRGGLYLYFESSEDIFKAVLANEASSEDPDIAARLADNPTCADILTMFFLEQKKDILKKGTSLVIAMYEYSFYLHEKGEKTLLEGQKEASIKLITKVLNDGIERKEFIIDKEDVASMAKHIVYTIEGIKLFSRTGSITEEEVNEEFVMLMKPLIQGK